MQLQSSISVSNPSRFDLRAIKFFQVVFVGRPQNSGTRELNVFSALIISSSGAQNNFPAVTLATKLSGQPPSQVIDVGGSFFQATGILRQFWGNESVRMERVEELRRFRVSDEELRVLASIWPPLPPGESPLLICEPIKSPIPVLVFPLSFVAFDEGKAKLSFPWLSPEESTPKSIKLAVGLWSHASFTVRNSNVPDEVIQMEYVLKCEAAIQFDEVRIYFAFPDRCELQQQTGNMRYSTSGSLRTADRNLNVEVHELFSQPNTDYFPAWNKLGIKTSTLMRLNPSAEFENACRSKHVQDIQIQLRAIDAGSLKRRDRKALLASIFLATAIAVGVDQTRIGIIEQLFPFTEYATGTLWWIAMCLSLLPILIPPPKPMCPQAARWLGLSTLLLFSCWTIVAFFLGSIAKELIKSTQWGDVLPPIVCLFGVATAIAQFACPKGIWRGLKERRLTRREVKR